MLLRKILSSTFVYKLEALSFCKNFDAILFYFHGVMELFHKLNELSVVQMVHNIIYPHFNDEDITLAKYIVHLFISKEDVRLVLSEHIKNQSLIEQIYSVLEQGFNYSLNTNSYKRPHSVDDTEDDKLKRFKSSDGSSSDASVEDMEITVKRDKVNYLINTQDSYEPLQQLIKLPNGSLNKNILKGSQIIQNRKSSNKPHFPTQSTSHAYAKVVPVSESQKQLPIFHKKQEILETIHNNQITIVIGETGSGKTTQLTQYMYHYYCNNVPNYKYSADNIIACTQPRRIAAINVAKRVSYEMNCKLGELVGYSVRFDDTTSSRTKIKYLTDGLLVRECLIDPLLSRYAVIFLDEAHERSLNTDVLFGLIKNAAKKRKDLKVIVTSATLDAKSFASYFSAPILTIKGRTFPVDVLYSKNPQSDHVESCLNTIMQIHLNEPEGDILCFLTGQEEIDYGCDILNEKVRKLNNKMLILPLYASLPNHLQSRIFEPTDTRKVVLSTNIAETSVTIPGIVYVVDCGFVKQSCYDPRLGMDSLVVVPISQAQANQRSGRAGRTKPGKCYRLYTQLAYANEMLPNTIPEIQRTNMANTVLTLLAMGIYDLSTFDFMDKPSIKSINTAIEHLFYLGAVDEEGIISELGYKMTELPVDPSLAKTLIISKEYKCTSEILIIVAMLSVPNIWYRPREKQSVADDKKIKFHHQQGDHITLLKVYQEWVKSNYSQDWCRMNYVQYRSLKRARQIRDQLLRYCKGPIQSSADIKCILKSIVSGYFHHVAKKIKGGYSTILEDTPIYMHPSSALFVKQPKWALYHELIMTSKEYMRQVVKIEPKWLIELAPHLFKEEKKQVESLTPLLRGARNEDWRLSRQKRVYYNPQLFS
eukprot:NODE_68_length_23780_cov_0.251003.p2 type:complete len:874 gc:universal NODE_68_length_23780_cov_0.251003:8442-5821(-)